ncbi:MAG: hypothetical protein RL434_423 [Pseudomonadota bacterium]
MAGLAVAILIAACAPPPPPVVAVLIDDIGYKLQEDTAVVALPGPYAVAVLPASPHGAALAREAYSQGKEVLLHLPMEAVDRDSGLGELALRTGMDKQSMADVLTRALASVPHAIGVNNHMGSLLTGQPDSMHWLMATLQRRGPRFFIDSRTTPETVAATAAAEAGLAGLSRQVFLDHVRTREAVRAALAELATTAKAEGHALAIGHPFPETLAELERWSPAEAGVELVSLQALLARKVALEDGSALARRPECQHQSQQPQYAGAPAGPGQPVEIEGDALLRASHQDARQ